ncbi:MAG: hypothetical protein VX185_11415 [Pseudomonadota bacterium]|nr:hypothetical protein [Pseudomonadota bacterium]
MAKIKKKLTVEQKRIKKEAKAKRQKEYIWVFINGKQVRVKRPLTIDDIPEDEWLEQNADPIWLHQNEMWDVLDARESQEEVKDNDILKK